MVAGIVKQIRNGTRRRFTAEDKIQIVLEGACEVTGVNQAPVRKRCPGW